MFLHWLSCRLDLRCEATDDSARVFRGRFLRIPQCCLRFRPRSFFRHVSAATSINLTVDADVWPFAQSRTWIQRGAKLSPRGGLCQSEEHNPPSRTVKHLSAAAQQRERVKSPTGNAETKERHSSNGSQQDTDEHGRNKLQVARPT